MRRGLASLTKNAGGLGGGALTPPARAVPKRVPKRVVGAPIAGHCDHCAASPLQQQFRGRWGWRRVSFDAGRNAAGMRSALQA
jgi:hypothetical protein